MYTDFFNLKAMPFSLLPDADFLFPSTRHQRAMTHLEYGIVSQAGFIVITGEVGTGKTTILRNFIKSTGSNVTVGIITNPSATFGRLLHWIAQAFDLPAQDKEDASLYQEFVQFLLNQYGLGKRALLIIDEAQNLNAQMLEELRMISNVNNEKDQLLQVVLVGQPELLDTLKGHNLRQFVQRIAVHCHIDSLTPSETTSYIHHRLEVAGGQAALFDNEACATVYSFTDGVPRLINMLCDQALVYAFSEDQPIVSARTVAEVVRDRAESGLSAFKPLSENWKILLKEASSTEESHSKSSS
ncbi:MAG: AAA family ATPase [Alphaproteobacteria bacterium]|nr:AAA family ATPase [Alphaproteobacteria bacterium]